MAVSSSETTAPMRVAILANDAASYVKPMAEGLARMLRRVGSNPTIFYQGLERLAELPEPFPTYVAANGPDVTKKLKRIAKYLLKEVPELARFVLELRGFDLIVVVNTIPQAFLRTFFNDSTLRWLLPKTPIVLYDVFYLPTRPGWAEWLKSGNPEHGIPVGGNWGLERYDWYLCASVVSEIPMPEGPQPYSLIGLDLADGTLVPGSKTEFTVVLDFECPLYMAERSIQIAALEESKTKYVVLNGHYSIDSIRRIYREASVFFLAMRESFGLPICEAQACGSYIFSPYSEWCPSHWLKPDLKQAGPGRLSPNFAIYGNDKEHLIRELERVKRSYDPSTVVQTFHDYHPQFYYGDDAELVAFLAKVRRGEVTSQSRRRHGVTPLTGSRTRKRAVA